ncbi:MAG TPA: flagellar basal-body MS-ring/collar protein FliF [Gemmatimonadaceae bacterium]
MADAIQDLLDRVGGRQRAMLLIVGVAVAAIVFGISKWATAPDWVPAFTNQPIETVGLMTDKLTAAGIGFKLDRGGSDILVSENDLARARVTLAQAGLPSAGRPGMELFDQPSWGMTDFTQRINYRRALEGELERTIGKMTGVQSAQVHLALHEQSTFRSQDKPANASVVLKTTGGAPPAQDVVQGIAHLVASSVDGIAADHVTVLDDSGRMLSTPDDGSMASLTNAQLSTQREVEGYLQKKAEGLVDDIVGAGNARVRVSAALNFDKIERSSELVDPDKQATSTEQRYEITPGAQGGAASSNVAMSYDNSKTTETFSGAIGNIKKLSVAVLLNDKIIPPPANAGPNAGPNAKPTYVARTPEEIAGIESLIRGAVGADSARGDVVTVVATHFDTAPIAAVEKDQPQTMMATVQQFEKPAISLLAIAALLVVAMMLIKAIKSLPTPSGRSAYAPLALAAPGGQHSGQFATAAHEMAAVISTNAHQHQGYSPQAIAEPLAFPEQNHARGRVAATIAAKPDVSTRVVRAWLKEAV